ncbi:beta-ketoacyl synthase N-terminal-like domain-containing protein [Plantactinospora soyae]|uniref:3-oxoacyl-[acyl-carrier-protein] synthase II n=1 Tax=Plantactinospora soyae TaxID=1544732 RepID=A0A927R208_9ACTN|nr:beta-ketoacyl synthase N-terminal-like domain-containing protein [Plantactinospora soyae]MBE1492002.1 3-oxoacyl-[acyl-carrier-protein] synthase II [Plantactinospora soyae]
MGAADVVISGVGVAVAGVDGPDDLLRRMPAGEGGDPARRLTGKGLRYKDRATRLALCAGRDALADAGLLRDPGLTVSSETVGVVVSSNYGNVDTICDTVRTIADETYVGLSPMALPATASNVIASWLAIWFRLRGANLTMCNGPTSGLDAVNWARLLVLAGRVDRVLVVGVEPDNPPVRHLVTGGASDQDGVRPRLFDGAAALVLESARAVRDREVEALATVGPYARKADQSTAVAAIRGTDPRPVDMWFGSGAGGPTGITPASTYDLTAYHGDCSGALGVLQCVAGTAWLSGNDSGAVLASADGEGADAAAALLLTVGGGRS